ncbi:hypothetical protein WJX74_001426 [Apatococcus lobatus]|uniref:Transmembrane protein 230 n=2 Tax=Apatococcus TaxID=904362 RepID=A0AAW1SN46_9CHLO
MLRKGGMGQASSQTYVPLSGIENEEDDKYCRFTRKNLVPVKEICLGAFLLLVGVIFILLAYLHYKGHIENQHGADWGLLTLGLLTFIPGFYTTNIAIGAWRGMPGYSFDDIPVCQ